MYATMMHYKPYFHQQQQQMLMDQYPYYQYALNDLQAYYSSSDHQEEDNDHTGDEMPSETSGDQSPNGDMFRLAFAASQWSKLVLNAEGLFNKLMSTHALPPNEQFQLKTQIEQWLCMKQEYEECIAADESGSLQGYTDNTRKSLERIEEVTETDEKTDESSNWNKLQSRRKSCSESEASDEDQSDAESENPDFLDKLNDYMEQLREETDKIIASKKNDCSKSKDDSIVSNTVMNNNFVPIDKPMPVRNQSSRRTSILPHSDMSKELADFHKQNNNVNLHQKDHVSINSLYYQDSSETDGNHKELNKSHEDESMKEIVKVQNSLINAEHLNALKVVMIDNVEKQSQMKKIQSELDSGYKQFEELQKMIKVKEQCIEDMQQNADARNNAKQKFQKKRSDYEKKYRYVKGILEYKRMHRDTKDEPSYHEEIEKYENLLTYYGKKIEDARMIKQVAGNAGKTLTFWKNSLCVSKEQLDKLKQHLKSKEERRKSLEDKFIDNHKKVKELEDKYNMTASKLKEVISESEDERNYSRLRLKNDDNGGKSSIETNEKISFLNNLVKENSALEKIDNVDGKENIRQDIRKLRDVRDKLIEKLYIYKAACEKMKGEKIPVPVKRQRKMLLINEYIELIDTIIEQKNVMICDTGDLSDNIFTKLNIDESMVDKLKALRHEEIITLFYKYLYKVIDLKESSKTLEVQNTSLEDTLKKQEIEHETRICMLQDSYEQQLNLLWNYYADETSSSSLENKLDRRRDYERLVKENEAMRKRLTYFDSLLKTSASSRALQASNPAKRNKQVNMQLMQVAGLPPKTSQDTKVTRVGNKLIFKKISNLQNN